jgi:hypothetical protein
VSTAVDLIDEVARLLGDRHPVGVGLVCNLEFLGDVYDAQAPYVMAADVAATLGEAGIVIRDHQLAELHAYQDRRSEVVRPNDAGWLMGMPLRSVADGPRLELEALAPAEGGAS